MTFPERDLLYLKDMLTYATIATEATATITLEDLQSDIKTKLLLERCIEIIGEAAKNVTPETQGVLPALPWREMSRTRDFFAHHYFRIDPTILWQICTDELPEVISVLKQVVS